VLRLLHTSDIHSRLWPFRARISDSEAALGLGEAGTLAEVGGVARLATLLDSERRHEASLWLDSGDAIEGAPIFLRYGGRVELELLGSLGLSAMALGNHELSLEAPRLAELIETSAVFPLLAADLPPAAGSPLSGWLRSSVQLEAGGVRVGVIGVANTHSPPGVGQTPNAWELAPITDVSAAVQLAIDELAPRVDLVVVLSHLGLDGDRALIRGSTGIGALLGGHQHLLTAEPVWEDDCSTEELRFERGCSARRVPILHSGAYGQWLTRLDLQLAPDPRDSSRLEVTRAVSRALPVAASVPERPDVVAYLAQRAPPPEPPLGLLPSTLLRRAPLGGDSLLGDLTADAMRLASGADVVVFNSSGLRDDLEAGVILRSDLELAFPFPEPWLLARLSGSELRRGLLSAARRSAARGCESSVQVAGLRLRMRCARCDASPERCLEVERESPLGRAPLLDDERLLVAMPEYLTLPGADFEGVAPAAASFDVAVPEALARLLSRRPASSDPRPCADALGAWSLRRCFEAFGEPSCPLDAARALALCTELPLLEGTRDGRIEIQH
jgi:5'-nucleotidase